MEAQLESACFFLQSLLPSDSSSSRTNLSSSVLHFLTTWSADCLRRKYICHILTTSWCATTRPSKTICLFSAPLGQKTLGQKAPRGDSPFRLIHTSTAQWRTASTLPSLPPHVSFSSFSSIRISGRFGLIYIR